VTRSVPLPVPPAVLLVLVRHGATVGTRRYILAGRTDLPLSPLGRRQARAVGRHLADWPLTALYASPLRRARETAEQIARRQPHITCRIHPDLRELDLGVVEGWSAFAAWERWPDLLRAALDPVRADFAFPGGETRRTALARFEHALFDIAAAHPGEVVAVVTHGALLGLAGATWAGAPLGRWRDWQPPLGSLTLAKVRPDGDHLAVRLIALGLTDFWPSRLQAAVRLAVARPPSRRRSYRPGGWKRPTAR
jgi:broad specificity phosphatase PhoE